jgi:hypothetical protein
VALWYRRVLRVALVVSTAGGRWTGGWRWKKGVGYATHRALG